MIEIGEEEDERKPAAKHRRRNRPLVDDDDVVFVGTKTNVPTDTNAYLLQQIACGGGGDVARSIFEPRSESRIQADEEDEDNNNKLDSLEEDLANQLLPNSEHDDMRDAMNVVEQELDKLFTVEEEEEECELPYHIIMTFLDTSCRTNSFFHCSPADNSNSSCGAIDHDHTSDEQCNIPEDANFFNPSAPLSNQSSTTSKSFDFPSNFIKALNYQFGPTSFDARARGSAFDVLVDYMDANKEYHSSSKILMDYIRQHCSPDIMPEAGSHIDMGNLLCCKENANLECCTSSSNGCDLEGVATTKGMRCLSRALLQTPKNHCNGNFNCLMLNLDDKCHQTIPTKTYKRKHCKGPHKSKIVRRVELMVEFIEYITVGCGVYVNYFNVGGDAVKSMMKSVLMKLSHKARLLCSVDYIGTQHAHRFVHGSGSPQNLAKQMAAVSRRMEEFSDRYMQFIVRLNLFRRTRGLPGVQLKATPHQTMCNDIAAKFVTHADNQLSLEKFSAHSEQRTRRMSQLASAAVMSDFLKRGSSSSSMPRLSLSALRNEVDARISVMNEDEAQAYMFFLDDVKSAALFMKKNRRRCQHHKGCTKHARAGTDFCSAHGGGKRCHREGCKNGAVGGTDFCVAHGGGKRCHREGCKNGAVGGTDFCSAHGGGKRCHREGCKNGAVGDIDFCVAHGGGKRCHREGCKNGAQSGTKFCIAHGGGKRCHREGCKNSAQCGNFCKTHGGKKECSDPGCKRPIFAGGKCSAHQAECASSGCTSKSRGKHGFCQKHKPQKHKL